MPSAVFRLIGAELRGSALKYGREAGVRFALLQA
jgi:hypothetical protein